MNPCEYCYATPCEDQHLVKSYCANAMEAENAELAKYMEKSA